MPKNSSNYLADALKTKPRLLTYSDGFRLGLGFAIANLAVALVVGGLAWAIVTALNSH